MTNDDLAIKLTTKLIENKIGSIVSFFNEYTLEKYNELNVRLGTVFKKYLNSSLGKYSEIKTLLYRDTPVSLYDFYVHLDVRYGEALISTNKVRHLLKIRNSLIITGTAGCGKSTLMRHLFINTAFETDYIPIFIELRYLDDDDDLIEYMYSSLQHLNLKIEKNHFDTVLKYGKVILFLDGFDEVKNDLKKKITEQILKIRDKYQQEIVIIISSRPEDAFISWCNFAELKVMPLSNEQAITLINNLRYEQEVKQKFIEELRSKLFETHKTFTTNPLLLTLMLMTFTQFSDIPEKKYIFYNQAFETLYWKHDSTKAGYKREMHSDLAIDSFEKLLAAFCAITYFEKRYSFTSLKLNNELEKARSFCRIDVEIHKYRQDLIDNVCILIQDGLQLTFTHRSFQEYFTALFIVKSEENIRYQALRSIIEEIRSEEVLNLVMEIDKEKAERDIIMPLLREIRDKYEYTSLPLERFLHRFAIKNMIQISSIEGKFYIKGANATDYYLRFINFIYEKYRNVHTYKEIDGIRCSFSEYEVWKNIKEHCGQTRDTFNFEVKSTSLGTPIYKDIVHPILAMNVLPQLMYCMYLLDDLQNEHKTLLAEISKLFKF